MIRVGLAGLAALGVFQLYAAAVLRWPGVAPVPRRRQVGDSGASLAARRSRRTLQETLVQAGLDDVRPAEFVAAVATLVLVAGTLGFALLGPLPAVALAGFAATFPVAAYRQRAAARRARAHEAWPRMIEELRVVTGSLGRSIPQALFEVGARAPEALRPAFAAAQREWQITTDFPRTVALLKELLADPTADATLETLLVAHQLGGSSLDRRLAALADDRTADVQGRKDARARQAGARFARRFVLVVPAGMALVGLQIGNGRDAYRTPAGQLAALVAIALVIACWVWAGRIMRLPSEQRVFRS